MYAGRLMSLPEDFMIAFGNASGPDWSDNAGEIWRTMNDVEIRFAVESGSSHIKLTVDESTVLEDRIRTTRALVVECWKT